MSTPIQLLVNKLTEHPYISTNIISMEGKWTRLTIYYAPPGGNRKMNFSNRAEWLAAPTFNDLEVIGKALTAALHGLPLKCSKAYIHANGKIRYYIRERKETDDTQRSETESS